MKVEIYSFAVVLTLGWVAWYGEGSVFLAALMGFVFFLSLPRKVESIHWKKRTYLLSLTTDHWVAMMIGAAGWIIFHASVPELWFIAPVVPAIVMFISREEIDFRWPLFIFLGVVILLLPAGYKGFAITFAPTVAMTPKQFVLLFVIPAIYGWSVKRVPPDLKKGELAVLLPILGFIGIGSIKVLEEPLILPQGRMPLSALSGNLFIPLTAIVIAAIMSSLLFAGTFKFSPRRFVLSIVYSLFLDGGIAIVSALIIITLLSMSSGQFRYTAGEFLRAYILMIFLVVEVAATVCFVPLTSMTVVLVTLIADLIIRYVFQPLREISERNKMLREKAKHQMEVVMSKLAQQKIDVRQEFPEPLEEIFENPAKAKLNIDQPLEEMFNRNLSAETEENEEHKENEEE